MTGRILRITILSAFVLFALFLCAGANQERESTSSSARNKDDVAHLYAENCARCHGKDGQAKTYRGKLIHALDFTNEKWQNDVSDERIFNSISNGRRKMPAFGETLREEQMNQLTAYVRHFKKS